MKALTVYQPWASLIIAGAKPWEFRKWAVPRRMVGATIVIHAGARAINEGEVRELMSDLSKGEAHTGLIKEKAIPILERALDRDLPWAAGLGTAVLGEAIPAHLISELGDSDRIDHHVMAWPLSDIVAWEPPVPAMGAQGFWVWEDRMEKF